MKQSSNSSNDNKIAELEKRVSKLEKYILFMEMRGSGIDPAYYDAEKLLVDREYITYEWLQKKLNIGYARTQHIIDKLEKEGRIGEKTNGREKRKVIKTKN